MKSFLVTLGAVFVFALAARTDAIAGRYAEATAPLVAQAPDAGVIAIGAQGSGTVRVLFARRGSMVLLKSIRLPAGQTVTSLSLSADGRDLVIGTESLAYLASGDKWRLRPVEALSSGIEATARTARVEARPAS
jgi:hypothetical protein